MRRRLGGLLFIRLFDPPLADAVAEKMPPPMKSMVADMTQSVCSLMTGPPGTNA